MAQNRNRTTQQVWLGLHKNASVLRGVADVKQALEKSKQEEKDVAITLTTSLFVEAEDLADSEICIIILNRIAKILKIDRKKKLSITQDKQLNKARKMIAQVYQKLDANEEPALRVDRAFAILHQLYSNIGLTLNEVIVNIKQDETAFIEEALSSSLIYSTSGLPNFIGDNPVLQVDEMEADDYLSQGFEGSKFKPINNLFYFADIANEMLLKSTPTVDFKEEKMKALTANQLEKEALKRANIKLNDGKIKSNEDVNHYKSKIVEILSEHGRESKEYISSQSKIARNLLRYLLRGTPARNSAEGHHYKEALAALEQCLGVEKRPELLEGLRTEIDIVFENAANWIIAEEKLAQGSEEKKLSFDQKSKQFNIFIHSLLALYPFLYPDINKPITIPQKVHNLWEKVTYDLQRLDISPQKNPKMGKKKWLASIIEDQDRIYAYGLTPRNNADNDKESHLLLMGTPHPTGQGSDLAVLYNFSIGESVGEGHDTDNIDEWIKNQGNKIVVSGQSKGATMAMITAARYPGKITTAHALNPAALNYWTLRRLQKQWDDVPVDNRPLINVYAQTKDPVFCLDNGFLQGTKIYRIFPNSSKDPVISNFKSFVPSAIQRRTDAHIQNFCGRSAVTVVEGNIAKYNNDRKREFFSDVKMAINIVNFPIQYVNLMANIGMRKVGRVMGKMAPLLKPIGWIGSLINIAVGLLLISTVIIAAIVAGIKVAIRKGFDIRSDYQKATPPSTPDLEATKGSTARLMALRDTSFCRAIKQPHEAEHLSISPISTYKSSNLKQDTFDLEDFDLPSGLSFR